MAHKTNVLSFVSFPYELRIEDRSILEDCRVEPSLGRNYEPTDVIPLVRPTSIARSRCAPSRLDVTRIDDVKQHKSERIDEEAALSSADLISERGARTGQRQLRVKIQTVTGEIRPDELGVTLPHEHLLFDLTSWFNMPEESTKKQLALSRVSMSKLGELRRDPDSCRDNLVNYDIDLAIEELLYYKRAGGKSLCDVTSVGLGRDPSALRAISLQTGINIVAGCGYYWAASHPARVNSMSEDQLRDEIVNDITRGIGGTDVKAGIIGEIGTTWPTPTASEEKVLRAAARAHQKTKGTINIHPFCGVPRPWAKNVHHLLDIVQEEGGELSRVVLSHMDQNGFDMEAHISLARRGAYIEYDTFGQEVYYDRFGGWDPRDTERVQALVHMIKAGYLSQLLISHDVCHKTHLKKYGGHGYDHILNYIVPMLRTMGVPQKHIEQIITENPKRVLAI